VSLVTSHIANNANSVSVEQHTNFRYRGWLITPTENPFLRTSGFTSRSQPISFFDTNCSAVLVHNYHVAFPAITKMYNIGENRNNACCKVKLFSSGDLNLPALHFAYIYLINAIFM